MAVTINGVAYQTWELIGYGLLKIIPYPLSDSKLAELKTAIESNGVFNSTPPLNDYVIPVYGESPISTPDMMDSIPGVNINSRWFAITDFIRFRYLGFFPVYEEPTTKRLFMVWVSLVDRTIYIWDNILEQWYDLLAGMYKGSSVASDFLWGDSSSVLWNDGTGIKEG